MADVPGDGSREREDEKNRWFQDRSAGASRPQQDLENAGREAWNAATRAGIDLAARTPAELRALGWRILNAEHSAPATAGGISGARPRLSTHPGRAQPSVTTSQASNPLRPSTVGDGVREAAMQADAAIRGAANVLTFGGADHFAAGMNALIAPGGLDHLRQRYDANLAQEHARDRYDAANRATAQAIGQIGGTLLGLRLLGPANGALSAARESLEPRL